MGPQGRVRLHLAEGIEESFMDVILVEPGLAEVQGLGGHSPQEKKSQK